MGKKFPQQFLLNPKFVPIKPDFKSKEKTPNLSSLDIYVTEDDYFVAKFQNIFTDYIINFTNKNDVYNWTHSTETYMKFWQCQLNFVVYCATAACGISYYHLTDEKLPNLVRSVVTFHIYYTVRKLLSTMNVPLPGDEAFDSKNNNINISKFYQICREYNVSKTMDFRFSYGFNHGMGLMYVDLDKTKNKLVSAQYGTYELVFQDKAYHSNYFGDNVNVNHLYNTYAKDGWKYFIPKTSHGLTQPGIQALNSSIRNYVYIILGSQVDTRSKIVSNSGTRFDAQEDFLHKFEKVIKTWNDDNMLPDEIARYQKYITDARIHLNYVIGPNLYLISDNLILNTSLPGYANNILVATGNQYFGINNINESQIPHSPFMSGDPDRNKRLSKQTDSVASKPRVTTKLKNKIPDNLSHENVRITLFLLSSLTLALVMYFK